MDFKTRRRKFFMLFDLLKKAAGVTDSTHAADTMKAAQCKGRILHVIPCAIH
jgi:hypothetical protein